MLFQIFSKSILKIKRNWQKSLKIGLGANNCTSELVSKEPKMKHLKIGTTMINVILVLISKLVGIRKKEITRIYYCTPPFTFNKNGFRNKYGIFSGGINDIIQSLARQREKEKYTLFYLDLIDLIVLHLRI